MVRQEAHQGLDQGAFARPIGANHSGITAALQREAHARDHLMACALDAQVVHLQQGRRQDFMVALTASPLLRITSM